MSAAAPPRVPIPLPAARRQHFGDNFIFLRVLHTDTAAHELRGRLNEEWATISVVAGLFVLLSGGSAMGAPELSTVAIDRVPSTAVYIVSMFAPRQVW